MEKNIIQQIRNGMNQASRTLVVMLFCLMTSLGAFAQTRNVKGTVVDPSGEPVIGATVRVDGTQRATVTDATGAFTIQAAPKEKVHVSYIGYLDAVVTANKTNITVTLTEDVNLVDELVVVGYGAQKKATLTGAISSVTNKEIVTTKSESVINMLSGKIPGVRITQMSSQPGAYDNKIDIRGMGDPLVIVDGIARDMNYFGRMDANEIESVSVLKDASAAIYGVRAANGVVLVTTKHGTYAGGDDKFEVTLQANLGWQDFLYVPHTASAVGHMLLINEKTYNGIGNNYPYRTNSIPYSYSDMLKFSQGQIIDENGNILPHAYDRGTDWTNELFDSNVPQQQYNVSINGSSKKIDYFVNVGYLDQMGSYKSKSMNYNRWNLRSNVDARITNNLKLSVALSGYMDERNEPFTDIWTVYKKAWTYRPTASAWAPNGEPGISSEYGDEDNPVATTNSKYTGFRRYKNYNLNAGFTLAYDIPWVKGLQAKAYYSYDYSNSNNTLSQRTYSLYYDNGSTITKNPTPTLRRETSPSYGTVMNLSLNYNRKFGDHTVSALALFEETYNYWEDFYAQATMLLASEYLNVGASSENQLAGSNGTGDVTRRAWIGRVNYDYKGRYLAEVAFRQDASSRWAAGHRWGFFPSMSLGYRISEEPWMKKAVPFLTNLKFRVSYGKMGDDGGAGTYPPTVVGYNMQTNVYGWFYGSSVLTGVKPTSIPNYNLSWYTAKTFNAGVDWDLWDGKFGGTVEVFKRKRDGLLATSSTVIPGTVGASLPQENLESDMTFGWEVMLSHRNRIGDVNYWINGQISATKNRWDKVIDSAGSNSWSNWRDRTKASGRNKDIWMSIAEGGRYSNYDDIWNHATPAGANALPGDYWYEDWNGDGQIDDNDRHPMATYNMPVFNYGITLGAEWKGVDFSMNFQGAAGVYNQYGEVFTEVGPFNGMAALDIYADRWHTANVNDDPWNPNTQWIEGLYPATGHSFSSNSSGILNTSYLRLKSVELGYTLPKTWLKFAGIRSVRLYVNAYNLLTFTGVDNIDPERPGSVGVNGSGENASLFYRYPVNRTFNVGATVKF